MKTSDCYCDHVKSKPHQITHGFSAYSNHRCRCDECRAGWAARIRDARYRREVRLMLGTITVKHGTVNAYGNYMCRCDACREAWTAYCRTLRLRRSAS